MQLKQLVMGIMALLISTAGFAIPISGQVINGSNIAGDYSVVRDCDDPTVCDNGTTVATFDDGQALDFDLELIGGEPDYLFAENQTFNTSQGQFQLFLLELELSGGEVIGGIMEYQYLGNDPGAVAFGFGVVNGFFNTYTYSGGVFTAYLSGGDCIEACGSGNDRFIRGLNFAFTGSTGQVPVPEPVSILLLGVTLLGMALTTRKK